MSGTSAVMLGFLGGANAVVPDYIPADLFVIGGGGGCGAVMRDYRGLTVEGGYGGSGGGGGVVVCTGELLQTGKIYEVIVGSGGADSPGFLEDSKPPYDPDTLYGKDGGNSSACGVLALGGGGGGCGRANLPGRAGGSGGGGGGFETSTKGGKAVKPGNHPSNVVYYGNDGADGWATGTATSYGGGGGGAGGLPDMYKGGAGVTNVVPDVVAPVYGLGGFSKFDMGNRVYDGSGNGSSINSYRGYTARGGSVIIRWKGAPRLAHNNGGTLVQSGDYNILYFLKSGGFAL